MNEWHSGANKDGGIGSEGGRAAPVFLALISLILVAPLPFGSYPAWAWAIMSAACGGLLLCWSISVLSGRMPLTVPPCFLQWSAAALGLAMLWGLLQTFPFMPESWHHPMWRDAADALDTPLRGAMSLDPVASRDSLLRIATYTAVFWLAFQYGRDARRANFALRALAIGSACYALFGLGIMFAGTERILWLDKAAYPNVATGTFVNPNSFGAYCGIGLLCAAAVLMSRHHEDWAGRVGRAEYLRFLLAEFMPRNILLLVALLLLANSMLLSLSRGAVASTALALLALFTLLALRRGISFRHTLPRLIGAMLAGVMLLFLAGQGLERRLWEAGSDLEGRAEIYAQTLMAIREAPIRGTGLGTFEAVYRSHRTAAIRPGVLMAHNDYLELVLELGIPAAALLFFSIALLAGGCARGVWRRQRNFEFSAVGTAACILVGAHSLVDFSLQIPAVAVTFSLVLGIAVTQAIPEKS